MEELTCSQMENICGGMKQGTSEEGSTYGGGMDAGCVAGIALMGITMAGAFFLTGGLAGFLYFQVALYGSAAGMAIGCG